MGALKWLSKKGVQNWLPTQMEWENPKIMGHVRTIENKAYSQRWRMIKWGFRAIYCLIRTLLVYASRFQEYKNENQMVSGWWLGPSSQYDPPPPHPGR